MIAFIVRVHDTNERKTRYQLMYVSLQLYSLRLVAYSIDVARYTYQQLQLKVPYRVIYYCFCVFRFRLQ